MEKILVRVEHPDSGNGMYAHFQDGSWSWPSSLSLMRNRHEDMYTPRDEGLPMTREHFCAFSTLEDMEKWVRNDEVKVLVELGFQVLLLTVSQCHVGKHQCIFKKEDVVEVTNITSIFLTEEETV